MKKISLFLFALGSSSVMFAQQLTTKMSSGTRFGIKGGANLCEFKLSSEGSSSSMPETQNRGSFNGGFLVNLPLGNMFRLQPELVYSGQGSRFSQTITYPTNSTITSTDKLGYINLPVMLQLQTENGFFVEVGPQVGYLISAKNVVTGAGSNNSETNIKDQLKKTDFAAAGGIGYLSRVGLGVDARYVYGFRNIYDTESGNNSSAPETKNRVIQIGLFYQFGAGK
jgi:hypothetical protein